LVVLISAFLTIKSLIRSRPELTHLKTIVLIVFLYFKHEFFINSSLFYPILLIMSTGKDTVSTGKVMLNFTTNWEMWNKDLASRAVGYSLWDYIQGKEHLIWSYLCLHASAMPRRRLVQIQSTLSVQHQPKGHRNPKLTTLPGEPHDDLRFYREQQEHRVAE
jgi:hypothetical protein